MTRWGGEQPHSNIPLILAKIMRPISRKLGGEETNFAPKITILQPIVVLFAVEIPY